MSNDKGVTGMQGGTGALLGQGGLVGELVQQHGGAGRRLGLAGRKLLSHHLQPLLRLLPLSPAVSVDPLP
jgi:hypothetical protein